MVLWLCIQLVFTHFFCLCQQEIWDCKARSASMGKARWHLDERTLLGILFRGCLALTEGNCLRGKFSLNTFYCFQIIANDLVSFQFVEAGGLGSPLHLAGSHPVLSAHPDLLISEEEKKQRDLKSYPQILEFSDNLYDMQKLITQPRFKRTPSKYFAFKFPHSNALFIQ